jgi:hypothetical protein
MKHTADFGRGNRRAVSIILADPERYGGRKHTRVLGATGGRQQGTWCGEAAVAMSFGRAHIVNLS